MHGRGLGDHDHWEHMPETDRTDVLCYEELVPARATNLNGQSWMSRPPAHSATPRTTGIPKGCCIATALPCCTYATLIPDAMNISVAT